jgi:hypothetical protein
VYGCQRQATLCQQGPGEWDDHMYLQLSGSRRDGLRAVGRRCGALRGTCACTGAALRSQLQLRHLLGILGVQRAVSSFCRCRHSFQLAAGLATAMRGFTREEG